MANYNNLKAGIDAVIKTNGRQEISGAALNAQLKNMITELGAGYQYMGVATPATNPGTPDANVFYLASEAGTYTDFGGIVINEGEVCDLVWNGTWTKQVTGAATTGQVSQLGQEADIFFPHISMRITPDICSNSGYIASSGVITPLANYGHSDPIAVQKGQSIVISGVGTGMPYFAYCTQDGTFIRASVVSTGISSVYKITFVEDGYVQLNGRVVPTQDGEVVSGFIYDGLTLEDTEYLFENNVFKYVSSRGTTFTKSANNVTVTVGTVILYDIISRMLISVEDSTERTLDASHRYLVYNGGNIYVRGAVPSLIEKGDVVLLYFDATTLDIEGGVLYPSYIKYSFDSNIVTLASTRGAVYNLLESSLEVTLGRLVMSKILGSTIIEDNTKYTLSAVVRYLVVTSSNTIATRASSAQIQQGDIVLLYYDDNSANKDAVGGLLYPDYIKWKQSAFVSGEFNNNVKKYVSTRSASYTDGFEKVKVVLGTLFVFDSFANPITTIQDSNEYTLNAAARYLVLTNENEIATRIASSSILKEDYILLYYDTNDNAIRGGALYANYLALRFGSSINSLNVNVNQLVQNVDKLNVNVKRNVSTRGAVYIKNANDVKVILNSLFVYNLDKASANAISDNTEYTLNGSARFLVLQADNTIATRISSAWVLSTDFILLYYDDNAASRDIKGGALYADYLKSQTSNIVIPSNLGQINCIRKAYQMASFEWTPKIANAIPNNNGTFPASKQMGMIYSSAKEYTQFVFEDISLETFMTAVNNPRSVLYTENINGQNSRSALGRTYHGINCAAYYGSVCSGLLTFAYGLPKNVTTYEFRHWDKMEVIADQTPYGLEIGDAVWQTGHIQLVTGITKDKYGFITDIEIVENAAATTQIKHYSVDALQTYITTYNCVLLRYKELYANRSYTPLTDFVAVMNETKGTYNYNNDLCPNYGDKSNYNEGDEVVLNLRTDYASAGFTTLEVYKGDTLLVSRAISGQDEILSGLEYGDYKARITGSENSEYCHFKVVNAEVNREGDLFTFSSANATPLYYEFCDIEGRRSYDIVGLSTHTFTSEELLLGSATPSGQIVSVGDYHYLKVHFQTDYGRIIKVIDWSL